MTVDPTVLTVILTTLGGVITQVLLQLAQWFRDGRRHQWQVQQMQWDRSERDRVAQQVIRNTNTGVGVLVDKIEDNTKISKEAFDVGNHINEKLVAIGEARLHHLDSELELVPGKVERRG